MEIKYTINIADFEKIYDHLTMCNRYFLPPLDSKVNIEEYSKKLIFHADRFEAWANDNLIGLVAVYLNDKKWQIAFITNVSVLDEYGRLGVATRLIVQLEDHARIQGFKTMELEVSENNRSAIGLYEKLGFSSTSVNETHIISMSKYL